jgi:phage-related baseplate assembly protein
MSYAAEPYAQFVEDMLLALTGGITRQEFHFLPEEKPFKLTAPGPILPTSVTLFGQANGAYRRFVVRTDYTLLDDFTIQWKAKQDGTPAADATWPDEGTVFYANFEYQAPGGAVPQLTDRNPGSVVRVLGESFAREYAVFSRQLEAVYRGGFIGTAGGRDLDQLAALVGVTRRRVTFAAGSVVFGRSTPAPADIFIPAGTRVSTSQPPPVIFETTQDETLRRGNLSAEVPIQAVASGATGVVAAGAIQVIHRPILGIETVANSVDTQFAASSETDDAVRARAQRAFETAGQATTGALLGALTAIPGLREKDVRIEEDPLAHPGVVKLNVALPVMSSDAQLLETQENALEIIEATRPVGVRVLTNINAPKPLGVNTPGAGLVPGEGGAPATLGVSDNPADLFILVNVVVRVSPTTLSLTAQEKIALVQKCEKVVRGFIADAGIGEILIYNRLIAELMAVDQVLDVAVELYPQAHPEQPHHKNLVPDNSNVRPSAGIIDVQLGSSLVMLDVSVAITLKGAGLLGDPNTSRAQALAQIQDQLTKALAANPPSTLSPAALLALLSASDTYSVTDPLHYNVEYQDAGVRIHQQDTQLPLSGTEQLWLRHVTMETT